MMVLSQLQFRKYLDNQVDPITAAATRLLPRPATLGIPKGDFDVLVISPKYGLIVGEVKAVGADPQHTTDQAVVAKVMRAVKQLNTAHNLLGRLVSDLGPITITKILMLPNVTTEQLLLHAPSDGPTAASAAAPRVHRHMYDFEYNDGDMEIAANQLAAAAKGGELYIIADEAFSG
nr:hypothetical protein BaRGS_020783 [Batillaria attramentaria]